MKGFIKGFINSWRNNSTYTWEFYSYDQETDIKTELIINFTGSEEEAMKTLDLAKEYLHSFEQKLDDKD